VKKSNKKKIMSKASIGMSLLLSSVLLCGSALYLSKKDDKK